MQESMMDKRFQFIKHRTAVCFAKHGDAKFDKVC